MSLRVRDIPPGVKFCLVRNGHKFTMISQHEELHYLYRVIAHPWVDKFRKASYQDNAMRMTWFHHLNLTTEEATQLITA